MSEKKKSKNSETTGRPLSDKENPFGLEVKDVITGSVGTITAKSEFFNGCVRYYVEPEIKKDGSEPPKALWFDLQQLVVTNEDTPARQLYLSLQAETLHIDNISSARPGGPRPDPTSRSDHPDRRESA